MKATWLIVVTLLLTGVAYAAPPSVYRLGDLLTLTEKDGKEMKEGATARLTCDGENLILQADFTDSDIANKATQNNERTWETGDVCEFFFKPAGRIDYYELHVTPELRTLQLHIPSRKLLREVPFESKFFESGFKSKVDVKDGSWSIRMEIPLKSLGKEISVEGSCFAVCRYNYNKAWGKDPQRSSTVPMMNDFHSPDLWHIIRTSTEK